MEKGKYLTLKEAAQISGYASDYIGWLIRKGRLPGKQVYQDFVWVTTEQALRKYMDGARKAGRDVRKIEKSSRLLYLLCGLGILIVLALCFLALRISGLTWR